MKNLYTFSAIQKVLILFLLLNFGSNYNQAQCIADFIHDDPCPNAPVHFTDLSVPGAGDAIISWSWDFGDGGTSTVQNPSHTFPGSGDYLVTLCIQTALGCSSCDTNTVSVPYLPVASFTTSPVCDGYSMCFTDMSVANTGSLISWLWDFGDGTTSTQQNPCHTYDTAGIYNVTLTIVNSIGCSDDTTMQVEVFPNPIADFSYVSDCNYAVVFTDLSIANAISMVAWSWYFGDGGTSTAQNPTYVYADSGSYFVSLVVVNSNGCMDSITHIVVVESAAVTAFADSTTCNNTHYFTDLSYATQPGDSIVAWYWEFGDGATSTTQNPVHQYDSSATYIVTLSVTTALGCGGTTSTSLFVPTLTVADFTWSTDCDFTTYFTDLSQPSTGDTIMSWQWDFGDGSTAYLQNPVHTYSATGSYWVTLMASCSCGAMDTVTYEVMIYPSPDAGFTYSPAAPDPGDVVYFTDQSFCADSNDYILEWRWYFGDGDSTIVYYPDNPDVTHIYADTGMFMATLTVFDNDSCTESITQGVNINSTLQLPPLADFIIDYTCLNMYTFFTDLSTPNGGTPIVSWDWDFGDGGTSTVQNPQYLYAAAGNYDITLIVTNSDNLSDTIIKVLYAYPLPDVSMQAMPSFASVGDTIQFYGSSGSSIASWFWNFNDGNHSTLQNPLHVYQLDGLFDVSLMVTDTAGCMTTEYLQVRIYPELTFPGDSTAWNTVGDNSISGDEWRFRYGMIGDTTISPTEDTSFVYSKVYSLYDSTLSTQYSTYFGAIRSEGDKVYGLLPGYEEALLYDYTLEVGDTVWYSIGGSLCYDGVDFWEEDHYRIVTDIDSVEVANGQFRRRWQLQGSMNDTWIQGIGSVVWYGLFNPFISTASYCGDTYTFACMKEGDEVVYLNNPHCDRCFCDLLTYISQPQQADSYNVNVYPNPFRDHALIEFMLDRPAAIHVQLIDASGIMVHEIPLKNYQAGQQQLRLNTHDLGAGIYVLKVTFNGTDFYTAKLIRGF